MINAVGRDIPEEILEQTGKEVFQGNNYKEGMEFHKQGPIVKVVMDHNTSKMVSSIHEALVKCGAHDGMTLGFHHHFREGDLVVNMVMKEVQKMGIKDVTICASSLGKAHDALVPMIEDGTITGIQSSGVRGKIGEAISTGKLKGLAIMRSHGGRVRAIQTGETTIDISFIGAPTCDDYGNCRAVGGKSNCGVLSYSFVDGNHANKVVAVTDCLVPFPNYPAHVAGTKVDYVCVVDQIGLPEKIATGAAKPTTDVRKIMMAEYCTQVVVNTPYFKEGFSYQTGVGGASIASAISLGKIMKERGIKMGFAVGGMTKAALHLVDKVTEKGLQVQQAVIAGCAGGNYTNVVEAAHALKGKDIGNDTFSLAVYPSSQPVFINLTRQGYITDLMEAGAIIRTAFCGPCFGAGDTPCNDGLSIRHTTRNFPNREGSKPGNGQMSAVALMDARSIAATAANGGILTSAETMDCWGDVPEYSFDSSVYDKRVYYGYGKGDAEKALVYGPNIKDWPAMSPLTDNILLKVCSKILDPVTTTDELIPSGETSSYRSNPLGLAEFTLSRRDPKYVGRSKEVDRLEKARTAGKNVLEEEPQLKEIFEQIRQLPGQEEIQPQETEIGSMIYAVKPGDGSAREQAASCQRVIGGLANITKEYATKRYRSNVMNWGMIPFQMKDEPEFEVGDYIFVPGIRSALDGDMKEIKAYVLGSHPKELSLYIADMTENEKKIVKAGCLINFNKNR